VNVDLGVARWLIAVDTERALDLAPLPRLDHSHAATDRAATTVDADLDVNGVGALHGGAQADPPGHPVRYVGPDRRARDRAAEPVLVARAARGQDVPATGPRRALLEVVLVRVVAGGGGQCGCQRRKRRVLVGVRGERARAGRSPAGEPVLRIAAALDEVRAKVPRRLLLRAPFRQKSHRQLDTCGVLGACVRVENMHQSYHDSSWMRPGGLCQWLCGSDDSSGTARMTSPKYSIVLGCLDAWL
jgi:hypothetical protein